MTQRSPTAWRLVVAGVCSGVALGLSSCPKKPAGGTTDRGAAARPSLVVVIAVDQLRADLLDRYATAFTGGFKRLRDRGLRFTHTYVDHAITVSHPGHATLATGMHPSHHGIVDAAFYAGPPGARIFTDAVEDKDAPIVGAPKLPGASPKQFLATTLAEWIAGASPGARVVAVGSGRFSSLLHAGRAKGDVYWYDGAVGRYVTSSYYRAQDADWVSRFNTTTLPPLIDAGVAWSEVTPEPLRRLAGPDDAKWEADHEHVSFPHTLAQLAPKERLNDPRVKGSWFAAMPMLDGATLALAAAGVDALQLGKRGVVDYLGIVPSQVDDIGHWYGPSSREQLDNLIRLDRALGEFFDHLDASVGRDRWVVALSADHGIPGVPEERVARGEKARRVGMKDYMGVLDRVKVERERVKDPAALAEAVARIVEVPDFVADAMTPKDLFEGKAEDEYVELYRHSSRPDRLPRFPLFDFDSGRSLVAESGVAVRLVADAMPDLDTSVHGSPYRYDRSVPLIFMGPGIAPGASSDDARTVDLAPTLARLAGIPVPSGLDGKALLP